MIKKYIKRPIAVEALQWNGDNIDEVYAFIGKDTGKLRGGSLYLMSPEGEMFTPIGSYIIKDVNGDFYPCRETAFEKSYEEVN